MSIDCRECLAGCWHCHGTLIRHTAERSECTEPGCEDADLLLHALTIDCDAVGCGCGEAALPRLSGTAV